MVWNMGPNWIPIHSQKWMHVILRKATNHIHIHWQMDDWKQSNQTATPNQIYFIKQSCFRQYFIVALPVFSIYLYGSYMMVFSLLCNYWFITCALFMPKITTTTTSLRMICIRSAYHCSKPGLHIKVVSTKVSRLNKMLKGTDKCAFEVKTERNEMNGCWPWTEENEQSYHVFEHWHSFDCFICHCYNEWHLDPMYFQLIGLIYDDCD